MFERITRPFETPNSLVIGRIVASQRARSTELSRLIWGKIGTIAAPVEEKVPDPGSITFIIKDCDQTFTETFRKTNDVDIKNKDNPDQIITVRQIGEIKFKKPDKNSQSNSYVAQSLSAIEKQWNDTFATGETTKKCDDTYKLNWPKQ
jgi:hypothetical protein